VSGNDSPQAGEPRGLTSTGLHLAVRTVGAAVVIAVEGELDLQTVPQLVDAVAAAEATDLTVVIDLSRVTFLGSAAMGVLVDLGARSGGPLGQRHVTRTAWGRPGRGHGPRPWSMAVRDRRAVRIVCPAGHRPVVRPWTVMNLNDLLPLYPQLSTALESAGG
jgi:anti-sigma B factor antagonist